MKRTFFNSKSKDKQYIVIGCGRFGSSVAKTSELFAIVQSASVN